MGNITEGIQGGIPDGVPENILEGGISNRILEKISFEEITGEISKRNPRMTNAGMPEKIERNHDGNR